MDIGDPVSNSTLHKLSSVDDYHKFKVIERSIDNLTHIYGPRRDPLLVVIPITIIYIIIFVTGVIGNISTCIVISKIRSMHTATNYYLFSLAISDFLLLISGVPQEVYSIWYKYPYVFGEIFCVVRGLIAETSANATVLTITSFTVERYLAICHPFLQHTMSKLSRAVRLILVVWIVSICFAIPQALQFGVVTDQYRISHCMPKRIIIEHSFELSTVLFFLAPMSLITILYILIGLKLRTSGIMKHESGSSLQRRVHVNSHRQQTSMGTRRVLKMLVAVVFAFFVCWAPFHAQRLVAFYFHDQVFIYAIMTYISGILYYLSTCINPLLYNIMSNKFREAFKETLAKCLKQKRNDYTHSTYRMLSRRQRRWNCHQESGDYSGSSIRDDSLFSTATQRQSFRSMTITQSQPSRMRFDYELNCQCNSNQKQGSDDAADINNDKFQNINIIMNCSDSLKPKSKSKFIRYFQNMFRSGAHARPRGYYSPRTNHPINVNLAPLSITSNNVAINRNLEREPYERSSERNSVFSNKGSEDDENIAIDELTSYMEELRLRELR